LASALAVQNQIKAKSTDFVSVSHSQADSQSKGVRIKYCIIQLSNRRLPFGGINIVA